ncbi:MAG TPA: glycosyltransferase, partial [Micrococcaceae bacterium]|nr:glycosyltransferase [Micrococcaceae bacterium]
MTDPRPTRVVAVLVSYNRRDLLEKALDSLCRASRLPDALVVVDNASTDGARQYLQELDLPLPFDLVTLERNTGGAGGFAVGMAQALARHDPDIVWIMDDDTEPQPQTLTAAVKVWESFPAWDRPAFVASQVLWSDGRNHPMNTMRSRFGGSAADVERARQAHARPIRSASFVSLFIDAQALREVGLPVVDYFLWNDDFEFTGRLARYRLALLSEDSQVLHHTKVFDSNTVDIGERFYFEVRNKLWCYLRSDAFTWWERCLYGYSTVRRWVRMVRNSRRRRVVLAAGWRGLVAGLGHGPRSNAAALAGLYALPELAAGTGGGANTTAPADSAAGSAREPFSVLLPVYGGDDAAMFRRAIASVTRDQQRCPDQLVIVRDGTVGAELEKVLTETESLAGGADEIDVSVLRLEKSVGLAAALDQGLDECRFDIVARMDADDVALPQRFSVQLPVIESGADIVGSSIAEIGADEDRILATRHAPQSHREIRAGADFRSPFNHPSVVYRKSLVQAAGGYGDLAHMEDYWLWIRMIHAGAHTANVAQPLLKYRVSAGSYDRRGGVHMLRAELTLQKRMLGAGYTNGFQFLR